MRNSTTFKRKVKIITMYSQLCRKQVQMKKKKWSFKGLAGKTNVSGLSSKHIIVNYNWPELNRDGCFLFLPTSYFHGPR